MTTEESPASEAAAARDTIREERISAELAVRYQVHPGAVPELKIDPGEWPW